MVRAVSDCRSIDFVSVNFGYNTSGLILHNITLTIKRGQMTALVRASGAGKSTLVDLIPRFYDPTQGRVLIGVDCGSLRSNQCVKDVSQDTFIFNTSVRAIAYGTEEADEAKIREAAH